MELTQNQQEQYDMQFTEEESCDSKLENGIGHNVIITDFISTVNIIIIYYFMSSTGCTTAMYRNRSKLNRVYI